MLRFYYVEEQKFTGQACNKFSAEELKYVCTHIHF